MPFEKNKTKEKKTKHSSWYGLSCVPPKRRRSPNSPVAVNVTLFGNRVFAEDQVKLRSLG